ncbi:MAG: hypothetical protein EBY29_16445 [Planctomycetes bacterium]|nr:hypothetical protein [Planctomycetota bacterium]
MEDTSWMHYLELCGGLVCAWLAAGWLAQSSASTKSKHGSQSDNSRRPHSGLLGDQGDRQQRKRRIKRRTLNL